MGKLFLSCRIEEYSLSPVKRMTYLFKLRGKDFGDIVMDLVNLLLLYHTL